MEDNKLLVTNEEGKQIEMEIMFTFSHEGKDYVVYFDPSSPDEDTDVFASIYDENGNLYPIETEEEWNLVDEMLDGFLQAQNSEEDDEDEEEN